MISIQNSSEFLESCIKGRPLSISILSEDQKQISDHFANQTQIDTPIPFISNENCHRIKGAIAWYETVINDVIPVGDHHLILCDVIKLERDKNGSPLVYYLGYKNIGKDIL